MTAALVIVTKIDFWPPVGVLVVITCGLLADGRGRALCYMVAGGTAVGAPVILALREQFGRGDWLELLLGFGTATEFAGRTSPTLERVVLETTSAAVTIALLLAVCSTRTSTRQHRLWLGASITVGVVGGLAWIANGPEGQAYAGAFGWPGRSDALLALLQSLARHMPSALLPIGAFVALARFRPLPEEAQRRRVLLLLAVVACAARARRMAEHIDFQNILIEVPLYIATLSLVFRNGFAGGTVMFRRAVAVLAFLAGFDHYLLGSGLLTLRGWRPAVRTLRGTMHVPASDARALGALVAAADSIDASRQRPVFAFGYSGGLNYFMRRSNPTATTQGFAFSVHANPEENVALIEKAVPPVLLVDNMLLNSREFPQRGLHLFRWRAPTMPSPYMRLDRPLFDRMAARCSRTVRSEALQAFRVIDCAP